MRSVPLEAMVYSFWQSVEKKALTMGFLFPAKVKGKKLGSLCRDIILRVRSLLQVRMNLESLVQVTPVMS